MKRLVGLMFCCVLVFEVLGQGKVEMSVSEKWENMFEILLKYGDNDNQMALCYTDSLIIVSSSSNDSLRIARSHRLRAQILRRLGNLDGARTEYKTALNISRRNDYKREIGFILNGLALLETFSANFDEALALHVECLALRESNGNCDEIASTLVNIGLVYLTLGNYENALMYFQKVIDFPERVGALHLALINSGVTMAHLKELEKSNDLLRRGLQMCGENCSLESLAYASYAFGILKMYSKNLDEAECYFLESLRLGSSANERRVVIESLLSLSRLSALRNDWKKSLEFLRKCENKLKDTKLDGLQLELYGDFCNLFLKLEQPYDVHVYQQKYSSLINLLFNSQKTKGLMDVHAKLSERQNQLLITYQKEILLLKEESIEKHRTINVLTTAAVFLLIAIAILLYRTVLRKEVEKRLLDSKVRDRTLAVEENLKTARARENINELLLNRLSAELGASIASAKGLCLISKIDPNTSEEMHPYFLHLSRIVDSLQKLNGQLESRDAGPSY